MKYLSSENWKNPSNENSDFIFRPLIKNFFVQNNSFREDFFKKERNFKNFLLNYKQQIFK